MRIRYCLAVLALVGSCLMWDPAPARAMVWPFSLFGGKKAPVKRPRPKPGQHRPGASPGAGHGGSR